MEKIIEIPVPINRYIEKPYEKIIEVPVESIKENIIWKDTIVDCDEKDM